MSSSSLISTHCFRLPLSDSVSVVALSFGPGSALQLWVLDQEGKADQLAAAFPDVADGGVATAKSEKSFPQFFLVWPRPLTFFVFELVCAVLGLSSDGPNDPSGRLSSLLSRQFDKPVFVGFNCSSSDDSKLVNLVFKGVLEEAKAKPECF